MEREPEFEAAMSHLLSKRLLRLSQVLELVPVKRSAWYAGIATGQYPASVSLGGKAVFWRASDILALIESAK